MSAHRCTRQHGISLVELLLGLAITALIMGPLVPMMQTASAAARISGDRVALERDADFALERIAARIRITAASKAELDKPNSEWLTPAVYSVSGGVLVEQQGSAIYTLAESVTAFSLTASATDSQHPLVTVSLSLGLPDGSASTSASATVRMGSAR